MTTRYAIVDTASVRWGGDNLAVVSRYLPSNYTAQQVGTGILVSGTDSAGWTLDGYVLPRLASGGMRAREVTAEEAAAAAEPEPMSGQEYAEDGGGRCPWCRSTALEAGSADFEGNAALVPVECLSCGRGWAEEYRLTGFWENDN